MSELLGQVNYSEDNIRTLEWQEHIRLRPGMYIGKLGDGSSADDGIYILLKEILDNSIDEFRMKAGNKIPAENMTPRHSKSLWGSMVSEQKP